MAEERFELDVTQKNLVVRKPSDIGKNNPMLQQISQTNMHSKDNSGNQHTPSHDLSVPMLL